jgi:hypothetical protein
MPIIALKQAHGLQTNACGEKSLAEITGLDRWPFARTAEAEPPQD